MEAKRKGRGSANMVSGQPLSETSDEALFLRDRDQADQQAFDQLVHRYEHELSGYLRRLVHHPELAEDVFQAAFTQLHLHRDQYDERRALRPWLYRIATHLAIDALRKERHRRAASLDAAAETERGV
jgi:RNA polymerase sigma-70 factor (ECF subfamily)